jgi:hypothetical protein
MTLKDYLKRHHAFPAVLPPVQFSDLTEQQLAEHNPRLAAGIIHRRNWKSIVAWAREEGLRWDNGSPVVENNNMFEGGDWNSVYYHTEHGTLFRSGNGEPTRAKAIKAAGLMMDPPLDFSKLLSRELFPMEF